MILNNKNLYVVDYDNSSGNGHLQRSIKFSDLFNNQYKNYFLTKKKIKFTNKKFLNIQKLNKNQFFNYSIIDSYKINKKFFFKLKKISKYIININDNYTKAFETDFLINYSNEEKSKKYHIIKKKKITQKLLGKKYNFTYANCEYKKNIKNTDNKIFIYLGTLPQKKIISNILKNLLNIKKKFNILIVSPIKIQSIKNLKIKTKKSIKKKEFLSEVNNSNFVITSTGVTVFEAVAAKKIVFGCPISKNQKNNFNELKKLKLINSLKHLPTIVNDKNFLSKQNEYLKNNHYLRSYNHLFNIKQKIFPIKNKFNKVFHIDELDFSKKNIKDLYNFQTIENRKYFINKKKFSFKSHEAYIRNFKQNPFNLIFIIKFTGKKIGYIKLNHINNFYDCSIILDKTYRNKGFSSNALKYIKDNESFFNFKIKAKILFKNKNSIRTFENAGFKRKKDLIIIYAK